MSNFRNAVYRRTHQERGQVTARKRHGLLEKKKDYKLRAQDYHRKKDRLQELQEQAIQRNPDEFYFGMTNTHVKDGKHVVKRVGKKRNHAEMLEMKTQDIVYLENERLIEQKKIEKLLASSSGFHGELAGSRFLLLHPDAEEGPESATISPELASVAAHYGAPPQAIGSAVPKLPSVDVDQGASRRMSRVRRPDVPPAAPHSLPAAHRGSCDPLPPPQKELKTLDKERLKQHRELMARIERKEKIDQQFQELVKQKNLMGKGRRSKFVKRDRFGDVIESETVYKWAPERKR